MRGDKLKLPERIDTLCRWLVHRDWGNEDYNGAWESDKEPPQPDDDVLGILKTLFERPYRDSRFLHSAWELLESSSALLATDIQSRFLSEFGEMANGTDEEQATVRGRVGGSLQSGHNDGLLVGR